MFDIDVKLLNPLNSHKHTKDLLTMVNKFLKENLEKYEAFLDIRDNKQRIDNVFLELFEYSDKIDREIWRYYIKFPTDRDNSIEIENKMTQLSTILNNIDGVISKINFVNTLIDVYITEFKACESEDVD